MTENKNRDILVIIVNNIIRYIKLSDIIYIDIDQDTSRIYFKTNIDTIYIYIANKDKRMETFKKYQEILYNYHEEKIVTIINQKDFYNI